MLTNYYLSITAHKAIQSTLLTKFKTVFGIFKGANSWILMAAEADLRIAS